MNEATFENWMSMRSLPDGSILFFSLDDIVLEGVPDPLQFDLLDLDLRYCLSPDGVMTCTIKCSGGNYAMLMGLISANGTARIALPEPGWFSQWRVAVLDVDHPCVFDTDHMTGNLTFTVTNTAPDGHSVMGPEFGNLVPR